MIIILYGVFSYLLGTWIMSKVWRRHWHRPGDYFLGSPMILHDNVSVIGEEDGIHVYNNAPITKKENTKMQKLQKRWDKIAEDYKNQRKEVHMKRINLVRVASEIALEEGLKSQVKIGNVREIQRLVLIKVKSWSVEQLADVLKRVK